MAALHVLQQGSHCWGTEGTTFPGCQVAVFSSGETA